MLAIASLSIFIKASVMENKANASLRQLSQEELELMSEEANDFQDYLMEKHEFV